MPCLSGDRIALGLRHLAGNHVLHGSALLLGVTVHAQHSVRVLVQPPSFPGLVPAERQAGLRPTGHREVVGVPSVRRRQLRLAVLHQLGPGRSRLRLHDLRHTHATTLLRAGMPVHIVSKRLGHKNVTLTLNTYADVIPDDDTTASDMYASLLATGSAQA